MGKILVVASSILSVMIYASSASAIVTIVSGPVCSGDPAQCIVVAQCAPQPCLAPVLNTQTNASCTAVVRPDQRAEFVATHDGVNPDPVCDWTVTDGKGRFPTNVHIDSSDSLPVELTTFC